MELINNTTKTLKDDLSVEIKQGSKLSIAAACFSIYAFQELKEQLSQIEQLRFIFTSPTFVTEKAKKERREFYIPRLTRERSLYGTEFEIKLRNELTQKAIARECAEWIRQKVTFKSNVSDKSIQGQIVVDSVGYTPINNFTTVELGCEKGNVISTTIVKDESLARTLLADFNEIWNDSKVLQVVTDEVIDSITAAYNENSPDFIYSLKDGFRFKSKARKTMISAKKKYLFRYQLPISTITFTTAEQFSLSSILGITD